MAEATKLVHIRLTRRMLEQADELAARAVPPSNRSAILRHAMKRGLREMRATMPQNDAEPEAATG